MPRTLRIQRSLAMLVAIPWLVLDAQAATHAGLELRDPSTGASRSAPALSMDVVLHITGPIARAVVTQRFHNPGDAWVEGTYKLPLPTGAAVDTLRMRVGSRVFEGRIEEVQKARRRYDEARRRGNRASLVKQERPNLFTTQVANIGPGEDVEIELEYQELLHFADGRFELRVPLTLTPRYIPGDPVLPAVDGLPAFGAPTPQVVDAHRITPPGVRAAAGRGSAVSLRIELDAGLPIGSLESPSHVLPARTLRGHLAQVALHGLPTDRDFVLRWWPEAGHQPRAALWSEVQGDERYVMALIMPPPTSPTLRTFSRELVLVIDTSGSMAGTSIEEARAALLHALGTLRADDAFNVIRFSDSWEALWDESRPADDSAIRSAARFVRGLGTGGGTEMSGALAAALEDRGLPVSVRQVVFVTDGAVGNEAQLFQQIEHDLGRTRLFPVGIGRAPNHYFLERAARQGRGATVSIAEANEVKARIDELLDKIEQPALTDLDAHWNDAVEMWPSRLPDVYAGEPLVITARVPRAVGDLVVSGHRADRAWEARLPLGTARPQSGVARLWARRKIGALMDERRRARQTGHDAKRLREEIVHVALRHHLVSRFTSLVAVDVTPVRPQHQRLERRALPSVLPASASPQRLLQVLPATATPSPFLIGAGVLCCLLSALGLGLQRERKRVQR